MAEVGDTLSSLPNRPLPPDAIAELATHDHSVTTVPLVPRGVVDVDTVEWVLLQTSTAGFLLEYVPRNGWIVREKVAGDTSYNDGVYQELVERAIERQQERDGLWTALLDGGRRDLRDLVE